MNCKEIQKNIERSFLDVEQQLNKACKKHIETCEGCNDFYITYKKAIQQMEYIKHQEPILHEPVELTNSIMESIEDIPQVKIKPTIQIGMVSRILAAAVIALILTLGVEQYFVLNKLQKLESQMGVTPQLNQTDQNIIYQSAIIDLGNLNVSDNNSFSFDKISTLFKLKRVKQTNFTFYDIKRYIDETEALKDVSMKEKSLKN